jgi:hypothetical protein
MATFTPEQLIEIPDDQLQYLSPDQVEQRAALFRQRREEELISNSRESLREVKRSPDE